MIDHGPDAAAAAFEHAASMLAVAEGSGLVITALNASARQVYGERYGEPLSAAFPAGVGDEIAAMADEVFRTGTTYLRDELRLESPGGGGPEEMYLRLAISPCHGPDGSVTGVVTEATDVTPTVYARRAADARSADVQRRFDAAAETLVTLQDALLPEGLPVVPGLRLAARYLLTEDGSSAGGDWFDAIALPDGRTVLVVGDVVGHGLRASVVMGELRTLFEERVRVDGDVLAALELLEGRARRVTMARAATVCVVVVAADRRSLKYCTAGHPPPLLVTAQGEARYLPLSGAAPLGSGRPFSVQEVALGTGDVVVLYSDGLVERPGRTNSQNTVELAQAVAGIVRSQADLAGGDDGADAEPVVERIAREAIEELSLASGVADDVSLVAAQVVEPVSDLDTTMPAFPDSLRAVRHNVGDWLASHGIDQLDELALQHAVGELVSNVVEHAYPDGTDRNAAVVTVRGCLQPEGAVALEVEDRGQWRPPADAGGRGRGLAMAEGFADELEVQHGTEGTLVRLRHWPKTTVSLLTSSGRRTRRPDGRDDALAVTGEDEVVRVSGALDRTTADEFRNRLAHATRGGTKPIHLDLTDVTVLASAGVQVLYDAGAGDADSPLRLVASMGSAAQHVLDLVQLRYVQDPLEPAS